MEKKKKIIITKNTSIGEIIKKFPKAIEILLEYDLMCAFCPRANEHGLESLKDLYGFDDKIINEIINKLNKLVE